MTTISKSPNEMLAKIRTMYSPHLHLWMKQQFLDACSHGDYVIHNLLNELNTFYNLKNSDKLILTNNSDYLKYINYIYDFYMEDYLTDKDPNEWWAD
jgi:hypothetical protein